MVLGAIGKVLLSGVPIVLIGGCLLFAYQMFVKG